MKVDFSKVITGLKGEPLSDGKEPVTLSAVVCGVLLALDQAESAEDKVRKFQLAVRAVNGGVQDLSAEDLVLLKKLIGKLCPPLVVGRSYQILDGEQQ